MTRRVILLGLDGAIPEFFLKFKDDLPNAAWMIENGVFAPALSAIPIDTPTNWTTIATGAWTGTHGITSFGVKLPGDPVFRSRNPFCSNLCQAEYIWETLERANMRSILVNYPVAWPFKTKKAVIIGGDGIFSYQWMVTPPVLYDTESSDKTFTLVFNYKAMVRRLEFKRAEGWKSLPDSDVPCLEAEIKIGKTVSYLGWGPHGQIIKEAKEGFLFPPTTLYLLAYGKPEYNRLAICDDRGFKENLMATLRENEWSPWIYLNIKDETGERRISTRFKLLKMTADAKRIILYQTDGFTVDGWAYPKGLEKEIIENAGPYHEGFENPPTGITLGAMPEWFSIETTYEQVKIQADWVADTCKYLTRRFPDWRLLMAQVHTQDPSNHEFLNYLNPGFPGYTPEREKRYWKAFKHLYKITDYLLGRLWRECGGKDTAIILVSDHGATPLLRSFNWTPLLYREGLIGYKWDEKKEAIVIDPSKLKVAPGSLGFWINLKGRDPGGIVDPEEYEALRDRIIRMAVNIRDPQTGLCPVAMAIRKENAFQLGLWGERIPDVIIVHRVGFLPSGIRFRIKVPREYRGLSVEEIFERLGIREFGPPRLGGTHVSFPNDVLGVSSNRAVFMMAGCGVKKLGIREKPINLVDVAPTICYMLGAPQPANAEGRVLFEFLEE